MCVTADGTECKGSQYWCVPHWCMGRGHLGVVSVVWNIDTSPTLLSGDGSAFIFVFLLLLALLM